MTTNVVSISDPATLRHIVSELRWHLHHTPNLRTALSRLVRRYEDELDTRNLTPEQPPEEIPGAARVTPFRLPPGHGPVSA